MRVRFRLQDTEKMLSDDTGQGSECFTFFLPILETTYSSMFEPCILVLRLSSKEDQNLLRELWNEEDGYIKKL